LPYFFPSERDGDRVFINGADARHLAGPLRARPGELIEVIEAGGHLLGVRLLAVSSREVVGTVEWSREHRSEPRTRLRLAIAMLPAAGLEHILSRATELGVAGFVLVNADRSVGRGDKPVRWATICREAAMLAGRLEIPEVRGPVSLREALAAGPSLLLSREAPGSLVSAAAASPAGQALMTLAIGPEGGWSPAELEFAGEHVASLGPRNLRADTAALVAASVWLAGRGDL